MSRKRHTSSSSSLEDEISEYDENDYFGIKFRDDIISLYQCENNFTIIDTDVNDFLSSHDTDIFTLNDNDCVKFNVTNNKCYIGNTSLKIHKYLNRGAYGLIFTAINETNDKKYILKFIPNSIKANEYKLMLLISEQISRYPHLINFNGYLDCATITIDNSSTISNKKPEILMYKDIINSLISQERGNSYKIIIMNMFDGDVNSILKSIISIINKPITTIQLQEIQQQFYQLPSIFAQMYISLLILHRKFKYTHNDAHDGNFFYKKVKHTDYDYFHYKLSDHDKDIYIKNNGYFIVLGDYGTVLNIKKYNTMKILTDYETINKFLLDWIDHGFITKKSTLQFKFKKDTVYNTENLLFTTLINNTNLFTTVADLPRDAVIINDEPYII